MTNLIYLEAGVSMSWEGVTYLHQLHETAKDTVPSDGTNVRIDDHLYVVINSTRLVNTETKEDIVYVHVLPILRIDIYADEFVDDKELDGLDPEE